MKAGIRTGFTLKSAFTLSRTDLIITSYVFAQGRKPFCLMAKAFSTLGKKIFDVGQKLYGFIA